MRCVLLFTLATGIGFFPVIAADDKNKAPASAAAAEEAWQVPVTLGKDGWLLYENPRFGLTTMRERAESIGGRLSIESTPGRGTTVTFSMPLAEALAE